MTESSMPVIKTKGMGKLVLVIRSRKFGAADFNVLAGTSHGAIGLVVGMPAQGNELLVPEVATLVVIVSHDVTHCGVQEELEDCLVVAVAMVLEERMGCGAELCGCLKTGTRIRTIVD